MSEISRLRDHREAVRDDPDTATQIQQLQQEIIEKREKQSALAKMENQRKLLSARQVF